MQANQQESVVRILIVDDHPLFRQGVRMFVGSEPNLRIVGEAANGQEALLFLETNPVDLLLLDMQMPGQSGIEVTGEVKARWPAVKILVLTSFSSWDKIYPALKAGASGYILKDAPPPELLAAIKAVAAGGRYLGEDVASRLLEGIDSTISSTSAPSSALKIPGNAGITTDGAHSRPGTMGPQKESTETNLGVHNSGPNQLTPRELDVLRLIAQGLDNRDIAARLFLSEKTVKTHVANILQKLNVRSRTQAALTALQRGLV